MFVVNRDKVFMIKLIHGMWKWLRLSAAKLGKTSQIKEDITTR